MPSQKSLESPSPSISPAILELAAESRRGSLTSQLSRETAANDSVSNTLDYIHTSASRSDALTTFDEFSSPPRPQSSGEGKVFGGDIVQGGLSGLYSRIKASVGVTKETLGPSPAVTATDPTDDASVRSLTFNATLPGTESPVVVSASSSRLQSPLVATFPESVLSAQLQHSNPSNASLLSGSSIPAPHASLTEPAANSPEELRQRPNTTSPLVRPTINPRHIETKQASRLSNVSDVAKNSREPIGDALGIPDIRVSRQGDSHSFSSHESSVMDQERSPRPLARLAADNQRSAFDSSSKSPARRDILKNDWTDAGKKSALVFEEPVQNLISRPPLVQVSQSHLPGFQVSRGNSTDGDYSSVASGPVTARKHHNEPVEAVSGRSELPSMNEIQDAAARMRSKVLAKELWMRDETAKECFYCGESFSTFRRKHHCRICGNIFDAKCTTLVPGKLFGQSGRLRICRPCEGMVYGTEDDSSVFSEDLERGSLQNRSVSPRHPAPDDGRILSLTGALHLGDDHTNLGAPSMGIPVSRKGGESGRGAAVIEFGNEHSLIRPSSSRSLKSLSGLHRVAGHKRHHSRQGHQHMKSLKPHPDDRAPFHRQDMESPNKGLLPALHHDNIIDPDLAPFMSDEGSSEEESMSIFATLNGDAQSPGKTDSERAAFGSLTGSTRRSKIWTNDRGSSIGGREADTGSLLSRSMSRQRRRNLSIGSLYHARPSPRRSKSNSLLKGFTVPGFGGQASVQKVLPVALSGGNSKMIRSSSMKGDSAPAVELNHASLQHVRNMLKQMLEDAEIPDVKRWEKALMPILLQCTDDVNPDIQRNDDIDIRHYIKLKKIPGARPGDTAYVSGVVFTKNLALKSMPRSIPNPKILIVTFPIEYARHHQHFMSLDPVISQEREYLRNLVKRIAAANPHVLLVEKNVSGLALEFLEEAGIAVVYNVKASVLNAVSRCTQTTLITSVDKLAVTPAELGKCASFDVKTYVHGALKKTYIYFSGCQPDLGCTIVLRGAEMSNLIKLKRITEFMCFVVYNLKLETCVMRDEYVLIPANVSGGTWSSGRPKVEQGSIEGSSGSASTADSQKLSSSESNTSQNQGAGTPSDATTIPSRTDSTLAVSTVVASSTIKTSSEGYQYEDSKTLVAPSFYNDVVEEHKTRIISSSPFVKFMQPHLLTQAREQETKLAELKRLRDQYVFQPTDENGEQLHLEFELVKPEMVHTLVEKPSKQVRDFLFAVHDAEYETALHAYLIQKRQWEGYFSGNPAMFDPFNHQQIAVLYSMVNSKTNPCVGPEMIALGFYNEHDLEEDFLPDITLGQYVEDLCQSGNTQCSANGCDETMFSHHRQYVHGDGQMSVIIQKYPSRIRGMHNTILMWSVCRICGQETQVMPMSENTWKYSFGKYLELTFWSMELHPRAHACPHDIHRNHVRYFGFNNVVVRIQYDAIELYEVTVPRLTITWKVDSDLQLKNEQYGKFKGKLDRFMRSVKARIESIHVESLATVKIDACRAEVERLTKLAKEDHENLTRNLQDRYVNSRWFEIISLNRAARAMHENSIAWDNRFAEFEDNFFPSEKDIRRMTALQIKKIFESATSFSSIEEGADEVETEIVEMKDPPQTSIIAASPEMTRRLSVMSPEDTKNVLAAVVSEEHMGEDNTTPEQRSPTNSTEQDVQVEAVKHLDLATASDFPVSPTDNKDIPSTLASCNSQEPIDPQRLELSRQVSSTVDKMRAHSGLDDSSAHDANMPDIAAQESRIPRPIDSVRPQRGIVAPQLHRTQSHQPQSGVLLDPLPPSADQSESSIAGISMSKTEKLRKLIAEPARAFERRMTDRISVRSSKPAPPSMIPRSVPGKRNVFNLARHYEQLSREFEKQRMRERQLRESRGAYPLALSKPVVEVYRNAHEAVKESDSVDEPDNSTAGRTSIDTGSLGESLDNAVPQEEEQSVPIPANEPITDAHSTTSTRSEEGEPLTADQSTMDEDEGISGPGTESSTLSQIDSQLDLTELQKHEKSSLLRLLTNFWGERSSSGWTPLEYPFSAGEHVWGDSDIIVREDEPSSIIALALSSTDYTAKLRAFRKLTESTTPEEIEASIERNLLFPKNTNIRYAFENRGVRAQCKIFYAESFDALRRKCGVAERFVESMSRCLKWDSKGGKTKSLFLKTLDDRFVLKSLSPVEVNAFFKFAPDYFAFTHATLFNGLPSVIARMLGLFQVTIRNPASGMEFNWFMIVMENLFYDREPNRRFDLKGSMRNRKIESTGERDEVLLDENLVDIIFEKPIFVRQHTMKLLKASVWNDTLFLSKQNVMDYSLMAGFEDDMREIVVGIIDCIRTYTWDKKLETWIKDRGKNKPTVTSPKDYRNRFRIAMSKYILLAPNCWYQFHGQQIQGRPVRLVGRKGDDDIMISADGSSLALTGSE